MTDNSALIAEAQNYRGDNGTARWPSLIVELADALEATQPRTVTTGYELHALPVGTVLRWEDADWKTSLVFQRTDRDVIDGWDWQVIGEEDYRTPDDMEGFLPATILFTPTATTPEKEAHQ